MSEFYGNFRRWLLLKKALDDKTAQEKRFIVHDEEVAAVDTLIAELKDDIASICSHLQKRGMDVAPFPVEHPSTAEASVSLQNASLSRQHYSRHNRRPLLNNYGYRRWNPPSRCQT